MEPITLLAQFAPQLIKWINGDKPVEGVAKIAVDLAQTITGKSSMNEITASFQDNPDLVFQFQQTIENNRTDLEKAYLADTNSARQMQVAALQQDDVFSKRFVYYFAMGWSTVTIIYIFCITFLTIHEQSVRFADTVLGFLLGTVVASLIQYFYGSSYRSSKKDAMIQELSKR